MVDYYSVGNINDLVINHSALNLLDPNLGGHPKKFLSYFKDRGTIDSPSMERGTLLHAWQENPENFIVAELDKPAEQTAKFAEAFYTLYFKEEYKTREGQLEGNVINIPELLKIHDIYSSFYGKRANDNEISLFASCIFQARKDAQVDKRLLPPTVIEKFETICLPYLRFLRQAGNKIILDKQTKLILSNCQDSIKAHPFVQKLWALNGIKEKEFFWKTTIDGVLIKRKAKLDWFYVDTLNKKIIITDTKTTAKPVADFCQEWGALYEYRTDRQLLSYLEPILIEYNIDSSLLGWTVELYNIVVQTTEDFPCAVYKMGLNLILGTKMSLNSILNRVAFHIKSNNWDITMEEQLNGYITV